MQKIWIAALACAAASFGVASAQTAPPAGHSPAAMFSEADADHNGALSQAEFTATRTAHFTAMDANHDGSLAGAELPQMRPEAQSGQTQTVAHHFSADANNDGAISSAEFDAQGGGLFARLDANHDGGISPAELDQAMPSAPPAQH
jgi:Ca2+-binding EF-hand superfamily protein